MKSSNEWISISDMMTGLMMVFLFISILYIDQSLKKTENFKKVYEEYDQNKNAIYHKLHDEFKYDLKKWNAELIEDSLIIRFLSPQIMFDPAQAIIKPKFKKILLDFCPRYFKLLYGLNFIEEVRIEGHTSDEWIGLTKKKAYFKNMELSQSRTRSVLEYCINNEENSLEISKWAIKYLTANGLSSSRSLCNDSSISCREKNRRVDFRIQINKPIDQI